MARLPQLMHIAKALDLHIISIKDLVAWRMNKESLIKKETEFEINTPFGGFKLMAFRDTTSSNVHIALAKGTWKENDAILTRVHSCTKATEIVSLFANDFGNGISESLKIIAQEGTGVFVLLVNQDNSDDAVLDTLKLIQSQLAEDKPINPFSVVNEGSVQRNLGIGAQILHNIGVRKIRLLTRNPKRRIGLLGYGLEIIENIKL